MSSKIATFNPQLDLRLERVIDVPRDLVWEAWTTPKHLKEWFCPKPWTVSDVEIDLRPGGRFNSVMRSPEGDAFPHHGCYLEVIPNERLVWTDTMQEGFRPAEKGLTEDLTLTVLLELSDEGDGTRYRATAFHSTEAFRKQHADMGFEEGWGTVLVQMVEYIKSNM